MFRHPAHPLALLVGALALLLSSCGGDDPTALSAAAVTPTTGSSATADDPGDSDTAGSDEAATVPTTDPSTTDELDVDEASTGQDTGDTGDTGEEDIDESGASNDTGGASRAPLTGPIAPLTGANSAADVDLARPALAVKIDNHPKARPQAALDQADLVFDLRAEGVTRFMAVFHSQLPAAVGPVRSSRTSDYDLLRGLDRPAYASSGGNAGVMAGLASVPVHAVTNHTRAEYYRQPGRSAPHNLFVDPDDLLALVAEDGPPQPWFTYRAAGAAPPSTAIDPGGSVTIDFTDTPTVGFSWSDDRGGWLRTQDGAAHTVDGGAQLAPENVVIMVTTYGVSSADANSPEVRSTGTGSAVVLTGGRAIVGTWHRPTPTDKPILLDGEGVEVELSPGQTWILYPEAGQIQVAGRQI